MHNRPSTSTADVGDSSRVQIELVVEEFSARLSQFQFEKALEYVEDVRKKHANDKTSFWASIFNTLTQLAICESQYFGLLFFTSKFSFRKENLRDSYQLIGSELEKCLDDCELEPKETNMNFVILFLRQFIALVNLRTSLIELYITISGCNWQNLCKQVLSRLETIEEQIKAVNRNAIRMPQFDNLCTEVNVLRKAFEIDDGLLNVSILDTVLQMKSLKTEITTWLTHATFQEEPTKKSFFFLNLSNKTKTTSKLSLVRWFFYVYNHLMAKVNLYFHLAFTTSTSNADSRLNFANTPISFLQMFQNFVRRFNPLLCVLIMNRLEMNEPFFGFRYHRFLQKHCSDYCKPISGINGKYPALAYFPCERADDKTNFEKFHPSVTSLIQDLWLRGSIDTKVKYLYDSISNQTFFTVHVEKRIHLAVVFERKILEKDAGVNSFFNELLSHLRGVMLSKTLAKDAELQKVKPNNRNRFLICSLQLFSNIVVLWDLNEQ